MKIMGVDPGGTTGIAVVDVPWDETRYEPSPDCHAGHIQIETEWGTPSAIGIAMLRMIEETKPDLIVIEKFIITRQTIRYTRQPDALWIIGGTRFIADTLGIPTHLQPASLAKTTWDNTRLKESGWTKAVKGTHARDALRHALTACATYKPGVSFDS